MTTSPASTTPAQSRETAPPLEAPDLDPLRGHVAVITGVSSGIGRLAALELVRRGARVVGCARNTRGLASLELETQHLPGELRTVAADVASAEDVRRLADTALEAFGRIDTWVNNAGVMLYARVADTDPDELRRILDVNVVGVHHGLRTALEVMERQGGGTIVTIGSVESLRAFPLQSAYAASKHAVKALVDALRVELANGGSPVRTVLIEPSYINTPLFDHARSKIGSRPQPLPPMYEPEAVVDAILHVARNPVPEVVVGGIAKAMVLADRLSPRLGDAAMSVGGLGVRLQESDEPPPEADNLFEPVDEPGATHGRWTDLARSRSWYTSTIGVRPALARVLAGSLVAALALAVVRRR